MQIYQKEGILYMLEIYFIRHGESVGNKEDRFRGRYDFPLNDNGLKQARALHNELKSVQFDAIYSSPLKRAYKTAEIVADGKQTIHVDEGFTNISLGNWENQRKSDIQRNYSDLWKLWTTIPEKLAFPGMETLAEVQRRAYHALLKLIKYHNNGRIVIVSHRAVFKPLFAAMLNIPEPYFWKIHMDTAAFSIAEYRNDRGFTFTCLNFYKHLDKFIREDLS